ncbi:MAG: molybdenum cofactor biosynthesis protein MoaE [Parasporobacterium sp.]|nr:molybdenum cofactor biosynthesis protein MoaE [Parasporobacterium sp.]
MAEAKADAYASYCGMYLFHRGVVRGTAKAQVRENIPSAPVQGMDFNFDEEKVREAIERAKSYPGIYFMKIWLRRGHLNVGEDIMQVLVGGDIRSNVLPALEKLVADLKNSCVDEVEIQ